MSIFNKVLYNTKLFVKRNSSTILCFAAASGVVATTVVAVKSTPKAMRLIKEQEEEKGEKNEKSKQTKIEKMQIKFFKIFFISFHLFFVAALRDVRTTYHFLSPLFTFCKNV